MADGSGNFAFAGLTNGTYAITPSKAGYTFNPASQTATVNGANVSGINFTANAQTVQTFSISGTISPAAGGAGATVTLGGAASSTTTTSSAGAYTFTGLTNGSYTVTPSNSGYSFSPVSQNVTVNTANVSGVNFTAAAVQAHSVTVNWSASTSAAVQYYAYRATVSGGPYTRLNTALIAGTSYVDSTVVSGQTYYYVATAVDASGTESFYSNEGQVLIP